MNPVNMSALFSATPIYTFVIAIIVASHCFSMSIITLTRLHTLHNRGEGISFLFLCLAAAVWSLNPFINPVFRPYGWISALAITNLAIVFMLIITDKKPGRILVPWVLLGTLVCGYFLFRGEAASSRFLIVFGLSIFPVLIAMNVIIYTYGFQHNSRFHLGLAINASIMICGGFYDTFKILKHWPDIPASSIGTFFFVMIAGSRLLSGYLNRQGWDDYAVEMKQKEKLMQERLLLLQKAHIESVMLLSQTIEAKDQYTRGHCLRVRDFAMAIAKEMGLSQEHLHNLELAAILHDIGKIGIPGIILNKPGKLTEEEFNTIKKHPDIGAEILANVEFFQTIIPIIRHHHEKYDGSGYPSGTKSTDIPMESRILSIADIFDALTNDRPYRKAFSIDDAVQIIRSMSGTQLDPFLVDIFLSKCLYLIHTEETERIEFNF